MQEQQSSSPDTPAPDQCLTHAPEAITAIDLDLEQIHDVQRSWKHIRNERNLLISNILYRLVKENPSNQRLFSAFAYVPFERLEEHEEYKKQVALIADRLDNTVLNLEDKTHLLEEMEYMKRSHMERGIPREKWMHFSVALYDVLAFTGMSSKDLDAWKSFFTYFVNGIAPAT